MLLWLLLLKAVTAAELAVVRPFASEQEIQEMDSAFRLWNTALPCDQALAEFDVFLVYSRRLEENPAALKAAQEVQSSFQSSSQAWHRCFRSFYVEAANLTADEDIYDARGYAVRKDWVNGPNKVFRFILRSFLERSFHSDYEAFYFMEFDSTPLRPFWLDQFYAEVFHYPRTAIRGSRYRGDSWDNFLHAIEEPLLYHINGNAIYFLKHPWLRLLADKLEEDAASGDASIAFDVRMAQFTLDAQGTPEWDQLVPPGEDPYRDDSLLVGNYANTLLNESFEAPEFIRHGAVANVLQNLDERLVTLAVQSLVQSNQLVRSLTEAIHPFREVVILSREEGEVDFELQGLAGVSRLRYVAPRHAEHLALCDLAARVETKYFVFTDTYHFIPGPTHILVDGNRSVLPYLPADSLYCTSFKACTTSLDQAEAFYGVQLNYHHNKFETLFETSLAREFCETWQLAASNLGSFESCAYQGPSADDYIAWIISMDKDFSYVPRNKERVGWRAWSSLWAAHPLDGRNCSLYTESDMLRITETIKDCSLYIQDSAACDANPNCTFRAIFQAGKCMRTDEFELLPGMMSPRTRTWSSTRTTTYSSSTTASTSVTSSSNTWTSTSSSTATRSTSSTTSGNFSTSTRTVVTQSTTTVPIFCEDGLPSTAGVDVTDCVGRFAGEACLVRCRGDYEGDPGRFECGADGAFRGNVSCQEIACDAEMLPAGYVADCPQIPLGGVCVVSCPAGFAPASTIYVCAPDRRFLGFPPSCLAVQCRAPELLGVVSDCDGILDGQSCTASCAYGFEGTPTEYLCVGGSLQGSAPACARKVCVAPASPEISGCRAVHGQRCVARCREGFAGAAKELGCEDGQLLGEMPSCQAEECSLEGFELTTGVDFRACEGITTLGNCSLRCLEGFHALGDGFLTCQRDRRFTAASFSCEVRTCGNLSEVASFASRAYDHSCTNRSFGEACAAFCRLGWRLEGPAVALRCGASDTPGFEVQGRPAAESLGPRCVALSCGTEGLEPWQHDCENRTTGQSCHVAAPPGYVEAAAELICLDGSFQGALPALQPATCLGPTFPAGVGSTCSETTLNSECWAYCESGFSGPPSRYQCVLNSTGQLELQTAAAVECLPTSRRLQSCSDVRLADLRFLHSCAAADEGDVCLVHCSTGYSMEGDPTLLSCSAGQLVGGPLPSCAPQLCSLTPSGLGLRHSCEGRRTGENCTAWCEEGFSGASEMLQCSASGFFAGRIPSCERRLCEDLVLPAPYDHNCRGKRFGENCGVSCLAGFTGLATQLTCNGTFQGELPSCVANVCGDALRSPAFHGACAGLATGQTCEVTCNAGFVANHSVLTCDAFGVLVGAYPVCMPARCPESSVLHDPALEHDCDSVAFGRSCNVYCAPGYELVDETLTPWACELNGSELSLQGVLPHCEARRCDVLPALRPGYDDNCSAVAYGGTCAVSCGVGFAGGLGGYVCGADGVAQGQRPSCELITCDSNLSLPGILTTCEGVQMNRSCFAFCAPGYRLEGSAQRWTCDASGDVPAIDESRAVEGVALRGLLPVCLLEECSYNIPWSPRFSHNCERVLTGGSCEVRCTASFEGVQRTLSCGSDGALRGELPQCREVTETSTSSSTATVTVTSTWVLEVRANLTLEALDGEALSDPEALEGFRRGLTEIFGEAVRDVTLEVGPPLQLRARWSSLGPQLQLTLPQVEQILNRELRESNASTVFVVTLAVQLGLEEPLVWTRAASLPDPDEAPLLAAVTAGGVALLCCCAGAGVCRYRHRQVAVKSPAVSHVVSDSTDEGGTTRDSWDMDVDEGIPQEMRGRDFSATAGIMPGDRGSDESPAPQARRLLVQDAKLFTAGICLEEDEESDPEEVRLSLEDVGVAYEVGSEVSGSWSSEEDSEVEDDCFAL